MVPYAEHESGYSEIIPLALLKTTMSVYAACGICHAKTSVVLDTLIKALKGISKNTRY